MAETFEQMVERVALEVGEQYPPRLKGIEAVLTFATLLRDELTKGQEPVAWMDSEMSNRVLVLPIKPEEGDEGWTPLYLRPFVAAPAGVPDGWKLVPVEPTAEMCAEGMEDEGCTIKDGKRFAHALYSAMLYAAPAAPADAVAKDADALKRIQSKLKSATMCHPNGVMFLVEEALEIADAAMQGKESGK